MEITREEWLQAFIGAARPHFERVGAPLPARIRVAVGFTSAGNKGRRIGECWADIASADGTFEIFITPTIADSARVADILTHELVHAAVGLKAKHGAPFKKVATALGLKGKMTATVAGEDWFKWALPILDMLGPIPHAALGGGISSAPPKQKTALIKAQCPSCECVIRITNKWIDSAPEGLSCPVCREEGMIIG